MNIEIQASEHNERNDLSSVAFSSDTNGYPKEGRTQLFILTRFVYLFICLFMLNNNGQNNAPLKRRVQMYAQILDPIWKTPFF